MKNPKSHRSVPLRLGVIICWIVGFAGIQSAPWLGIATAQSPTAKETRIYKTVDGQDLKIYISKPTGWKQTDSRPAVVFFHGGGWVAGQPGQFDQHCEHLNLKGLVCFQVQYRLLKKKKKEPPIACINDAKSAMRWIRHNQAELGIDANRIASAGGSAGGHLAAFLGTTDGIDDPSDDLSISARSNAMLLFNPVYNNGPGGWGTGRVGRRFRELSPAHNISPDDAPSIVFLGTQDRLIPVSTVQEFQQNMQSAGVQSALRLYAGANHGFFNSNKDEGKWYQFTVEEMDEFLENLGWIE